MKKFSSSLKTIFTSPFIFFKKITKDSFTGGLIFGAIFSLIVNVYTIQIQETIQKQRVFEALENEILTNLLTASSVIDENDAMIKDREDPDYFHIAPIYNDNVWRSSEALKYIVQLDPEIQAKLYTYYDPYILQINQFTIKDSALMDEIMKDCYFANYDLPDSELMDCKESYYFFLNEESIIAEGVYDASNELLVVFHPTQDRLNSRLLRMLMGKDAIGALTGE